MRTLDIRAIRGESGNALVVTLIILFSISVIAGTLAMISSLDLKIAGNQRATTRALPVAEAGLNEAIHRLSLPNPTVSTVSGWTGNVAVSDSLPYNPLWTARIYLTAPGSAPSSGDPNVCETGTLQDPNQPYLEYSAADGTDGVLTVMHKWRDVDGDNVRDANEVVRWDPLQMPPENLTWGFPVEVVTVRGYLGDAQRTIEAEVTKRTIIARTLGAVFCNNPLWLTGNVDFCGYNHSITTPAGLVPPACYPYHLASGHLPGGATTGDDIHIQGGVNVVGSPAPTNTSASNPWYSLAEVLGLDQSEVDAILADADNTSLVNPLNGITYINGDLNVTSNLTGEGLLYVTGALKGAGAFAYRGLVYVEGDFMLSGDPWILGSLVVNGTANFDFNSGNAAVLYSKDALSTYLSRPMPCIVLSWSEK